MVPEAYDHRPRPLVALDLVRFGCALLVVAFHLSGMLGGTDQPLIGAGWVGVELFFVLSGVVIAWSAEGSTPAGFAGRRALRLLPAAWLCSTITASVLLIDGAGDIAPRWLVSIAFDPLGTPIDPSYWTLAIEVNFYVAVAIVLRGGSSIDRIERFAVALGCASVTYWVATLVADVPPVQNRLAQLTLLPHGCFFALGVLMRAHTRGERTRARTFAALTFVAAGTLEIVAHAREFPGGAPMVAAAMALFAAGLLIIARAGHWQSALDRPTVARTAAALASLTYPLYLLHQQVGRSVAGWLDAAGLARPAALAITFVTVLALAWIVARHLEPAARRALVAGVSRCRGRVPDSRPTASPSAG